MENFILDSVSFVGNIDFAFVVRMFLFLYLFFWIMVVIWVWFDASERSSNVLFKVSSVVVTFLFNIFGLIIYLLVRPTDSYEERYLNELEKKYLQLETSGIIKCPKCGFDLEPDFVVCPRCGEAVKAKCEECGEYIDSRWEYCAFCGVERDVPKALKQKGKFEEVFDEEDNKMPRSYYLAIKHCVYRVGEKQNECLQKTRDFFKKSLKKKKVENIEKEGEKEEKLSKKDKKKKKKNKR